MASGRVRPGGHRHRGGHLRSHFLHVAVEHGVAVALCVQQLDVREGDAGQPGQHVGVRRGDLDQALHAERVLDVDPAHRRGELPGEQVDDVVLAR